MDNSKPWEGAVKKCLLAILLCAGCSGKDEAGKQPEPDFAEIDAMIKASPDDPDGYRLKSMLLFNAGREQEAMDTALITMEKYKAATNDLSWMIVGAIVTNGVRIDVHYNRVRTEQPGRMTDLHFPYSFRVWSAEKANTSICFLDFEIGYLNNKPMTAAVGETIGGMHHNYGMLPVDADFATVKAKVLDVIASKLKQ